MSKTLQSYKTYSIFQHQLFKTCLKQKVFVRNTNFITNHLKSKNTGVVKKILLGVPNEAVVLRITKVHLNINRSLH